MFLIAGLGNPEEKYKNTPHNIGFEILDYFALKNHFPNFEFFKKCDSLISKKSNVILVKPQTYMNKSGEAIKKITSSFKIPLSNILIIHDDLDIEIGNIKISKSKRSAGHKGVESLIIQLKSKNFIRLRVGISKNKEILKRFNEKDQKIINCSIQNASDAVEMFLSEGLEKTTQKYNQKV